MLKKILFLLTLFMFGACVDIEGLGEDEDYPDGTTIRLEVQEFVGTEISIEKGETVYFKTKVVAEDEYILPTIGKVSYMMNEEAYSNNITFDTAGVYEVYSVNQNLRSNKIIVTVIENVSIATGVKLTIENKDFYIGDQLELSYKILDEDGKEMNKSADEVNYYVNEKALVGTIVEFKESKKYTIRAEVIVDNKVFRTKLRELFVRISDNVVDSILLEITGDKALEGTVNLESVIFNKENQQLSNKILDYYVNGVMIPNNYTFKSAGRYDFHAESEGVLSNIIVVVIGDIVDKRVAKVTLESNEVSKIKETIILKSEYFSATNEKLSGKKLNYYMNDVAVSDNYTFLKGGIYKFHAEVEGIKSNTITVNIIVEEEVELEKIILTINGLAKLGESVNLSTETLGTDGKIYPVLKMDYYLNGKLIPSTYRITEVGEHEFYAISEGITSNKVRLNVASNKYPIYTFGNYSLDGDTVSFDVICNTFDYVTKGFEVTIAYDSKAFALNGSEGNSFETIDGFDYGDFGVLTSSENGKLTLGSLFNEARSFSSVIARVKLKVIKEQTAIVKFDFKSRLLDETGEGYNYQVDLGRGFVVEFEENPILAKLEIETTAAGKIGEVAILTSKGFTATGEELILVGTKYFVNGNEIENVYEFLEAGIYEFYAMSGMVKSNTIKIVVEKYEEVLKEIILTSNEVSKVGDRISLKSTPIWSTGGGITLPIITPLKEVRYYMNGQSMSETHLFTEAGDYEFYAESLGVRSNVIKVTIEKEEEINLAKIVLDVNGESKLGETVSLLTETIGTDGKPYKTLKMNYYLNGTLIANSYRFIEVGSYEFYAESEGIRSNIVKLNVTATDYPIYMFGDYSLDGDVVSFDVICNSNGYVTKGFEVTLAYDSEVFGLNGMAGNSFETIDGFDYGDFGVLTSANDGKLTLGALFNEARSFQER